MLRVRRNTWSYAKDPIICACLLLPLNCCLNRTSATASTWSLSRLDALAAEVVDVLKGQNPQLDPQYEQQPGSAAASSNSSHSLRAGPAVQNFAQQYPMQALTAVNSVLFGRHGYSACNRYGTASDSHLSAVLESGPGSCAALTVLYVEVRVDPATYKNLYVKACTPLEQHAQPAEPNQYHIWHAVHVHHTFQHNRPNSVCTSYCPLLFCPAIVI